jgi:monoterpene epsilon-lactone hydrolase
LPSIRSRMFQRVMRLYLPRLSSGRPVKESREKLERITYWTWFMTSWVNAQPVIAKGVRSEFITPKKVDTGHAILYLHGGGYTICSPATHMGLAGRIAKRAQSYLLLPDYRLAPENPFPAALEDAMAAWNWLLAQGYREEHISVGGDSAGGGLSLALALKLKEAQKPLPASIFLLSPWVDLSASGDFGRLYLPQGDLSDPLVSPLFGDLRGLPPVLIQAGGGDFLLQDSISLEKKLRSDGVAVDIEVWDGLWHVFQAFAPFFPEAQQAIDKIGDFICAKFPSPNS